MQKNSIRISHPKVFLVKGVLKTCSKFTGVHLCLSVISITTLLKSHFGMGVLLQICCIFSEQLLLRTSLNGCFYSILNFKDWKGSQIHTISSSLPQPSPRKKDTPSSKMPELLIQRYEQLHTSMIFCWWYNR